MPCYRRRAGMPRCRVMTSWVVACCLGANSLGVAQESARPGSTAETPARFVAVTVEPQEVFLHAANRQQQLLVTAVRADGKLVDFTRDAKFSLAEVGIARLAGDSIVGLRDGATELTVTAAGLSVTTLVRARGIEDYPPIHFARDVVPILSKLGCNSGGCHGRASGQNGFKLSVFGFDPAADHDSIVKQARGRRVFPSSPANSLILAKPSGGIPHGGGVRLAKDSLDYQLLYQWVDQGMPVGAASAPRLVGLRVSPSERVSPPVTDQSYIGSVRFRATSCRIDRMRSSSTVSTTISE